MQPLNHGSRCPTSGVARARYTRGSIDDGPGVSINRAGGLSSPMCWVMTFCPSFSCAELAVYDREPPAGAFLGMVRITAGMPIFAQSACARNRQIGPAHRSSTYGLEIQACGRLFEVCAQLLCRSRVSVSCLSSRHFRAVVGIEILAELARSRRIRLFTNNSFQNWLQESPVLRQCRAILSRECLFDRPFRCGCDNFQPSNEDPH